MRSLLALKLAVLSTIAAPVPAQLGSFTLFGRAGLSYHGGTLDLTVGGRPLIGETITLEIRNQTLCGAPFYYYSSFAVAIGISNQTWNGVPLPIDVTGVQLSTPGTLAVVTLSGRIYVSFDLVLPATGFIPRVCGKYLTLPIPYDPALLGAVFYSQGMELAGPYHSPQTWVLGLTQAGRAVIGL